MSYLFLTGRLRFIRRLGALVCLGMVSSGNSVTSNPYASLDSPYQRLQAMQVVYQRFIHHPWPRLEYPETLTWGRQDPSVLPLRQRLCATQDLAALACTKTGADQRIFDMEVVGAVKHFQGRHGLFVDGMVGDNTVWALNVSPRQRYQQIQVNLMRWLQLGTLAEPSYIWVNVPDHRLRLVKDHQVVFVSRVIVGKVSRPTPEIDSQVTRIILNPYWTVPPSIARHDIIPRILLDKGYLKRNRIRVFAASQPHQELEVDEVDWLGARKNPSRYILRQDPGPQNALGQIKFDFSNPHLVYLHDTPSKHLFEAEKRLFSSGCVRMENPFSFLRHLQELDPVLQPVFARSEAILQSGRTLSIRLKRPIPIHLTYITAWVDKKGVLHFWDDVYRRDPILSESKEKQEDDLPPPI